MSDIDTLAIKARSGDIESFGVLYDRLFDEVYRFIYHRVFQRELAEDICSQVFLKTLDGLSGFNPKRGLFRTWLYRIARNTLTDHFRRIRFTVSSDSLWDLPDDSDFAVDVVNRIHWEKLQPVLGALPSRQREVVVMRIWDQMSFGEIGRVVGRSEAACKMSYSRTIVSLRSTFGISLLLSVFQAPYVCGPGRK